MRYAAWKDGQLIAPGSNWDIWDEAKTFDQGSHPFNTPFTFVFWSEDPPGYQPFSKEEGIWIKATQDYYPNQ